MDIPATELTRIRELYAQGRYRQALTIATPFGPLPTWTPTPARLLAGRLAMQLGAPRLGRLIHLATYRAAPANLEAIYYHARYRFERFGPLSSWTFIREQNDWSDASPELRADWLAFNGFVASRMHDFDRAEKYLAQAESIAPQRAWLYVERAAILEAAERYDDALVAARTALDLHPWFRPAVQATAHMLQKRGRDAEAIAYLAEASQHLESGVIAAHLAALHLEAQQYAEAGACLDRYEYLSPLIEDDGRKWLAARRCDIACALGDLKSAEQYAATIDEEFYEALTERIRTQTGPITKPLKLRIEPTEKVPTIQEWLSKYWQHEFPSPAADASGVFDGLPDALERQRIEAAGWVTREFTLSADVVQELLAAKIPFMVTLVEVGVSQSRLVVGYDSLRYSVTLHDGHEHKASEAPLSVLFERYASTGPRCLVAVPESQRDRLTRFVDLPDADGYDKLYLVQKLFHANKSHDAKSTLDGLLKEYVGHRLAKVAALAWARLTVHPVLLLDAANDLLIDYPNDSTYTLTKASALRELGRTPERLAVLRAAAEQEHADPLILQSYAQMLLADHRMQYDAEYWLRRSVRVRSTAAAGYFLLASQAWEHQQFERAAELYRFAVCLDDREEQFAEAYFRVAKTIGQAPDALRLFQRRAGREGVPYPPAVKALHMALIDREEPDQAFVALDKAIVKLSEANQDSTELRLYRAEQHANFGRFEQAEADLDSITNRTANWYKVAARIARLEPDLTSTEDYLNEALVREPNWIEGHRQLVAVLIEVQGMAAARQYTSENVLKHPHLYPILRMRAELLSPQTDDSAAIPAVMALIDICPHDAWARRQLALVYADRKRDTEALEQIRFSADTEANHPSYFAVLAHIHRRGERIVDAMEAYRDGLRLNVDHDLAVSELVHLSRGRAERDSNAKFIVEQLHLQPHTGDGLQAYRDQLLSMAAEHEEDHVDILESLHQDLERILEERPDLWQAWSLMIQHYGLMQRLDEARSLAESATERFPLLAQLWSDLARVYGATEQTEDRIEALRKGVAAAPNWPPASQELADALAEADEEAEAIAVLERASARSPHDVPTHAMLADKLWNAGHAEEAFERAVRAVLLDPGFEAAWRMVLHWSDRLERPDEVIELARDLTMNRPGDARGWLRLARLLNDTNQSDEALAALETVIRLDPKNIDAYDHKAERLADLGRFDEALETALPKELAEDPPLTLQGRAAWIEAKRGNFNKAIPLMQKLVQVEPEYYWGWQQLAEWFNDTNRHSEYLEAANELVKLKPDHPLPLTMRGEAKLKTDDRAGGKTDLRDALRIAPMYAPAAAILFDACMTDGEIREARSALAVLQEHANGPEVLVKQIQFACRIHDAETALRALAEVASTSTAGPPMALQIALSEIQAAGWSERAAKVLHDSFQDNEEFNPWAPLFWLDTPEGEAMSFDERLAAIDTTIRVHPSFAAAHDRKAELLAGVGRYDEAITACRPSGLEEVPITLRGRAAWVEAKRGHRGQAITLMRQVVDEDPHYLWGWRNLAQWYDAEGRRNECLEAAEAMVRLMPDDPVAYGYRGEARRTLGDRVGAKTDFAKAFDLDPRFEAAGLHLIVEQLEADEPEAAARTLARVQEHAEGPLVKSRAVLVAAKLKDLSLARVRFRQAASDGDMPPGLLRDAANALDKQGWSAEVDDELKNVVLSEQATAAAATVWTDRLTQRNRGRDVLEHLPHLFDKNLAAGREAAIGYAQSMALAGQPDQAAATVHRFGEQLRSDAKSWARAGAALADAKQWSLAATWLSDWSNRDGLEAWMLRPLADALHAMGRDDEATKVCEAGAELTGAAATLAYYRGWLALAAALDNRMVDASELLAAIDRVGLTDGVRLLVSVAEAVVMVNRAEPDAKSLAFADAKDHLKTAVDSCGISDIPPGLGRWYKRAVSKMGSDAGHIRARMWSWWQQSRPWLKGS